MNDSNIEKRLSCVEKRNHLFQSVIWLQTLLIGALIVAMLFNGRVHAQDSPRNLRLKSLILEDEQGHARIIMGAPFPKVSERTRSDNATQAIVFLDEKGHDRLTLGQSPDPQVGGRVFHRIAQSFGVLIHDDRGDERGSYGWLTNGRALITLDRPGAEAWVAVVNDRTGEADMSLSFPPQVAADTQAFDVGTIGSKTFLRFRNIKGSDRTSLSTVSGSSPSFEVFDDNGSLKQQLITPSTSTVR